MIQTQGSLADPDGWRQFLTVSVVGSGGGRGTSGVGCPPLKRTRQTPAMIVMRSVPTNRKVGAAKAVPASRAPRRLRMVMTIRIPTHRETVCGSKDGNAETKALTAAENAYCGRQDVIGEERGRGKQAGRCAKPTIFLISDARRVSRTFAAVGGHPAPEKAVSARSSG
jgi:hypothetical protein